MAEKGLRSWVKENWVDIAIKKSDGSFPKCGRSGGEKRKKYPKSVPIANVAALSGVGPVFALACFLFTAPARCPLDIALAFAMGTHFG